MTHFIYLFKNQSLHIIGHGQDLVRAKQNLRPGQLVTYLEDDNYEPILKMLQNRYSRERLPQSDYFRLTKSQAIECSQIIQSKPGDRTFVPFFSGIRLAITFLLVWIISTVLIILYGIEPIFQKFT